MDGKCLGSVCTCYTPTNKGFLLFPLLLYLFVHVNNLQSFKAQSPLQMKLGSVSTKVFAPLRSTYFINSF